MNPRNLDIKVDISMASFDEALADLVAKVEAILSVVTLSNEAVESARAAVAEAEAKAERVVAEDAAEDAAQDAARADALAAVTAKLDSVLNPVEVALDEVPLEAVVADGEDTAPEA